MNKLNVYDFCMLFMECKEIRLFASTCHDNGIVETERKTFVNHLDHDIYSYKDFEVLAFKAVNEGVIEITAYKNLGAFAKATGCHN